MFKLGAIDGVSLTFHSTGALAAIAIPRYGRTLTLVETAPAKITRSRRPGPYFVHDEMPEVDEFALDTHGRRVVQQLEGGERAWEVLQSRSPARAGLLAWSRAAYNLDAPAEWRLSVNDCIASVQQSDGQITIQCSPLLSVRVTAPPGAAYETSSAKGEITGVTLTIPLPAGPSQVDIVVEARPHYDLADTLILCTPQQLGEASVLATCVRGKAANQGKYVPVIDVMNPPMLPEEYMAATEAMQAAVREYEQVQTDIVRLANPAATPELILPGGSAARSEEKAKELATRLQDTQKKIAETQTKVLQFAAWQRRWERVLQTALTFQPAQVVFLYPVPPDLAAAVAPGAPRSYYFWDEFKPQVAEWEKLVAGKLGGQPPDVVYFKDLEALSKSAWERLSGRPFEGAFTIPDDPRYYALGVRRALQTGKPLLPKGRAGLKVSLEAATEQANQGTSSTETVIVEADGTLASLAAALYADYIDAPLLVHPAANPQDVIIKITNIQAAIEKEELARQYAAAYAYIGEHKGKFLQDPKVTQEMRTMVASIPVIELPRSMPTPYSAEVFVQMASTYLSAKEQGVETGYRYETAQWEKDALDLTGVVTAHIDGLVRAKMLKRQRATVFTLGIPYTFVDGWRDKAITHVVTEPCLTVLRHVLARQVRPPAAAFTVVFDAGLLRPVESPAIRRRLRHGRTYPLVLREAAAGSGALQTYPAFLPVEGIFLDTLGDEASIYFVDQRRGLKRFSATELELTANMAHGPVVFSHIAFSWLAVGPACMAAGARAYYGTLYSVESEPALEMALRTLGTGAEEGGQSVDEMTRRAYIRLGLPDAPAAEAAAAGMEGELPNAAARQALLGAMFFLAEAGLHEQSEPLYRAWEALGQEDLAAAGDDSGFLKDELDAEEREYHRRDQMGRQKRASGETAAQAAQAAAGPGPVEFSTEGTVTATPPGGLITGAADEPGADKPKFFVP